MSSNQDKNKGKGILKLDFEKTPLWKHVEILRDSDDGGGNRAWSCNYCGIQQKSSYSRVKAHLLQIPGKGIAKCKKVTDDIRKELQKESDDADYRALEQKKASTLRSDYVTLLTSSDLVQPKKRKSTQSAIERAFNQKERDELDKEFARAIYTSAVPFNFVRNPYMRNFCYRLSVANVPGYAPPSYNRLRTTLLAQESTHVDRLVQPIKDTWVRRGVSLCSDGWSDGSKKPIINIMGASATTAVFVDAIDASGIRKESTFIAEFFIGAIEEIGAENIVQIVTDNGSNFKAAGKLIEEKYPSIFWTPCVVHCVNLAFKSICDPLDNSNHYDQCVWLKSLCDDMNEIQKFIVGHDLVRGLFDKLSKYKLLSVAETRFASFYVVGERLLLVKDALDHLVTSSEWRNMFKSTKSTIDTNAKKIRLLILDDSWWEKLEYFLDFAEPIYQMIRVGDKDAPVLHLVYDMWDSMIEDIKIRIFKKEEKDLELDSSDFFSAISDVLESRWNKSNTHLHCLAHSLVPKYYTLSWLNEGRKIYPRVAPHMDGEVSTQRSVCFQRLFRDPEVFDKVEAEFASFSTGLSTFADAHVIAGRNHEEPLIWWANHGATTPHLQALAFKLLSQPASSSCCERNWSLYDNIKTVKRNRLTSDRAKNLVKVHNNLRLLGRKEDNYKLGPSKYWDIGGDNFDVDAEVADIADINTTDPELEGVLFDLGYGDGEGVQRNDAEV